MTHSEPAPILTPTMKLLHASQDVLKLRPQAGLDVVLIEDLSLSLGSPRMRDRAARLTCEISTDGRPAGERIAIERLRNAVREYDLSTTSTRRVLCLQYGAQ